MILPLGFKFAPTDREIINTFLLPKSMMRQDHPPCVFVPEKQLYGPDANPWDVLLDANQPWWVMEKDGKITETTYCFTTLSKKGTSQDAKNFIRTAGCGTWDGQRIIRNIMDANGKEVGFMRMLNFVMGAPLNPNPNPGHWIMHEFVLGDGNKTDYVFCEIILDRTKKSKVVIPSSASNRKRKGSADILLDKKKKKSKSRSSAVDDEQGFASNSIRCRGGVGGQKEDDGGLRNKGKEIMIIHDNGEEDFVDHQKALGLTSISCDEEANNGLGMVGMEQNHYVNPSCSVMPLILQQENCFDTQFQLENDVNILGGDASFQAMQDSFWVKDANGYAVGCAGYYQVKIDAVGKDGVECSLGFQEKYSYDNIDVDEFVNSIDFSELPALYEQADEQLLGGDNHGGQLVVEEHNNDETELLGKRKCEDQDSGAAIIHDHVPCPKRSTSVICHQPLTMNQAPNDHDPENPEGALNDRESNDTTCFGEWDEEAIADLEAEMDMP